MCGTLPCGRRRRPTRHPPSRCAHHSHQPSPSFKLQCAPRCAATTRRRPLQDVSTPARLSRLGRRRLCPSWLRRPRPSQLPLRTRPPHLQACRPRQHHPCRAFRRARSVSHPCLSRWRPSWLSARASRRSWGACHGACPPRGTVKSSTLTWRSRSRERWVRLRTRQWWLRSLVSRRWRAPSTLRCAPIVHAMSSHRRRSSRLTYRRHLRLTLLSDT